MSKDIKKIKELSSLYDDLLKRADTKTHHSEIYKSFKAAFLLRLVQLLERPEEHEHPLKKDLIDMAFEDYSDGIQSMECTYGK